MKDQEKRNLPRRGVSRLRLAIGAAVLLPLGIVWSFFLTGTLRSFEVISDSMLPTLRRGDYVLMSRPARSADLHGRVVVFENPRKQGEMLTKRVVADTGDVVAVRAGRVLINGRAEDPPRDPLEGVANREWKLGPDELFVMGDNRNDSFDSIDFGPLVRSTISGVITYRYWPRARAGQIGPDKGE